MEVCPKICVWLDKSTVLARIFTEIAFCDPVVRESFSYHLLLAVLICTPQLYIVTAIV